MDTNVVVLIGRLTADASKRTYQDKDYATFTIAVNSGYGDRQEASFFRVIAWNKAGEFAAKLPKGARVSVVGRLKQDTYEKDGERKQSIEIVAQSVQALEPKKKDKPKESEDADNEIPF